MPDFVYTPPTAPWLPILHADRDIVVVAKPSGLLSVPGRGAHLADCALSRLRAEHPTARVVHRLDMDTSGVMLFALRAKAERALRTQFQERTVEKTYLARVWGRVRVDCGEIELPLRLQPGQPPRSVVDRVDGRAALTRFEVIARSAAGSLLALYPVTGRSHQLRVHLRAIGHPILGDRFYAHAAALAASPRLQLHAWRVCVDHPYSGERRQFQAESPFADADAGR